MMPGTIAERSVEQVTESVQVREGNGPGGRRLGRGEDIPMTAEQSARLGALYEEYGARLVQYACRKLMNRGVESCAAADLAPDIAQEAWVDLARTGAKDLLGDKVFSEDETRWILFARVKTRILAHYKRSKSHEMPIDWEDPSNRKALSTLLPDTSAAPSLSGFLAPMVDRLPEPQREALLGHLDGLSQEKIGFRLGCPGATAQRLVDQAVLLLQIDNPELSNGPVSVASLPAWQRRALSTLSEVQRAVLLRLDSLHRQILLLGLTENLGVRPVSARLGAPRTHVQPVLSVGLSALRALATDDMAAAA